MSRGFLAAVAQRTRDALTAAPDSVLEQPDLLYLIFSHLSPWHLLTVASVSRGFSRAASSDTLWKRLCLLHWQWRHARYRLTPQRAEAVEAHGQFKGWRTEFEKAARDSDRDHFVSAKELSELEFYYHRKRGAETPGQRFRFRRDGSVDGHPTAETFPWRLDRSRRAVIVGPREVPFPPLYASRESDWTWRLENRNVVLYEVGAHERLGSQCDRTLDEMTELEGTIDDDLPMAARTVGDVVAVSIEGEVFYVEEADMCALGIDRAEGSFVVG